MVMKKVHVFVTGRVQGVFFRAETKSKADSLNLTGWVRNVPDGRVDTVFEGEKGNVDTMIEWCRKGPPFATVTDIEIIEEIYTEEFEDFRIRY
ncbi:MAG: acylphosphatase [Syntrophales bacterium]|nr:acylphosphatase [Syntrophales bacterium]